MSDCSKNKLYITSLVMKITFSYTNMLAYSNHSNLNVGFYRRSYLSENNLVILQKRATAMIAVDKSLNIKVVKLYFSTQAATSFYLAPLNHNRSNKFRVFNKENLLKHLTAKKIFFLFISYFNNYLYKI